MIGRVFASIVHWRTSKSRARWSIKTDCCSALCTGTKRMFGRLTASRIASASVLSVLFLFT